MKVTMKCFLYICFCVGAVLVSGSPLPGDDDADYDADLVTMETTMPPGTESTMTSEPPSVEPMTGSTDHSGASTMPPTTMPHSTGSTQTSMATTTHAGPTPKPKSGFSASSFGGGIGLGLGICILVFIAYYIYSRKQSSKGYNTM